MKKPSQQYFCELVNLHMIVGKAEIIDFMKQKELKTSKNNTKAELLDKIEKSGYLNEFYDKFKEFFSITFFDMSKVLDIQRHKLTALYNIGYFKDFKDKIKEVEEDSYRYGKYLKVYLPLEILDLNKEKIEKDYAETFNRSFQMRLTTNTKEEAKEIQELLSRIFVISSIPSTYETRSKEKFNTYITFDILPYTELQENKYALKMKENIAELEKLKNIIEQTKNKTNIF